jgi:DNA-binding CsgD family transcriptional regulator
MQTMPLARSGHAGFEGFLEEMVASVGTVRFPQLLLDVASEIARCCHIAAFSIGRDDRRPRLVLAADGSGLATAYAASTIYVERFWQHDAVNAAIAGCADLRVGLLARQSSAEFNRLRHRRACYGKKAWAVSGERLIERVSLVRDCGSAIIRLDLYRDDAAGSFEPADLDELAGCGRLLLSFVARHEAASLPEDWTRAKPALAQIISRIGPDLSPREVEVCAGISIGLSSEAIASELNIGLNTVLTYRKRAYARLRISSHSELLHAIYANARSVGTERAIA